jgi:hypothetical protein
MRTGPPGKFWAINMGAVKIAALAAPDWTNILRCIKFLNLPIISG